MSGKRPGDAWGGGYDQQPAQKKKKETKVERILRQAAETAAAEAGGGAETAAAAPSSSKPRDTDDSRNRHAHKPPTPIDWGAGRESRKEDDKPKMVRSAAWDEPFNPPERAGWSKPPPGQQRAGQWGRGQNSGQQPQPHQSDGQQWGGNKSAGVPMPASEKKKESKMDRLKRQLLGGAAEADGKPQKATGGAAGGGEQQEGEEEGGGQGGEIGGWAAGAEADGVFEEGEGLMKLKDGKGKGKGPAAKPVGGAVKQALLREVVPQWMKAPLDITEAPELGVEALGLDVRLRDVMMKDGYSTLFPVQAAVIGHLLHTRPGQAPTWEGERDVCVCAPTGSGKTLCFCVPIVQSLMTRVVPRLRALIVVPSRDLAAQVFDVLEALCVCCDLRACLCAAKVTYAEERAGLSASPYDIIVATPGRLAEHMKHTDGFSLAHLRFLVMDEADRLLSQSYQGWISSLLSSSHGHGQHSACGYEGGGVPSASPLAQLPAPAPPQNMLRKLLFSATLTRNPSKLAPLRLRDPIYFAAKDARYVTPKELNEFMVPLQPGEKPLALVHLLAKHGNPPAVCFTNSVASSHRLYRLLEIYGLKAHLFSSELTQERRAELVKGVQAGSVRLVVCSDAMSRGMDLPSVEIVVNYDVPTSIKTYVHRVGRTARAGRSGIAYTLLHSGEVRPFKALLRLADNNYVRSVRVGARDLDPLTERYKEALKHLKVVLDMEKWRELDVLDEIEPLPGAGGGAGGGGEAEAGGKLREAMRKRIRAAFGC